MPEITSTWALRISSAIKYKDKWSKLFKCDTLEDYCDGFQWKGAGLSNYRPYMLNLINATIKRKTANILYSYPEFSITPQPGNSNWNQDFAVQSSQLKQDTLNTLIQNPAVEFCEEAALAAKDSFFRFAVLECGYAIDWRNPGKPHMELTSHADPDIDEEDASVVSDEEVDPLESVYVKWISARRFFVSQSDSPRLRNCSWCGYYSFIRKSTLLNTDGIKLPDKLKYKYYSVDIADATAYFTDEKKFSPVVAQEIEDGEIVKVWHIWDNIAKKRLLLLDGDFEVLYSTPFERLPFATYRNDISLKSWYPVPPVFQWLAPQDEINEAREQMRKYRRRATRKFEVDKNAFDPMELEKFKNEIDGEILIRKKAPLNGTSAIVPITNPDINLAIQEGLVSAKDDFNIVAANSIARGRASDRQTATATKQISAEEMVVESAEQIDFGKFLCAAGREMLLQMGENFAGGIWVKLNADAGDEKMFSEYQMRQPLYQWVTSQDIADGYDFKIKVSIANATPAQMEKELNKFVQFLSLVRNFPEIAMSPKLIRETAYRCGYNNEAVIQEYQKQAMLIQMEKAAMAQQSLIQQSMIARGGGESSNNAKGMIERGQPNSTDEVQAQLFSQV